MRNPEIRELGTVCGTQSVTVSGCGNFSVRKTFDCGQAFRFDPDGSPDRYTGIAFGKKVTFEQLDDGVIRITGSGEEDYNGIWKHYLALDADYDKADESIISAMPDEDSKRVMAEAVKSGAGIRILRQDPFETVISFIISQNNNIPRIKKIISSLCDEYGENGAFPTPERLLGAGVDGLFALRTGFRAGYIYDACEKIVSGSVSLDDIAATGDYGDCVCKLCSIRGIGPKVSSCILLFGFGRTEAFPVDVWMRRSLERHFPKGFDPALWGKYAGIAQQYLFYYERWLGGGE